MANKRDLKKGINKICSDLFAECVAATLYNCNADQANMDSVLCSLLDVHSDYIMRVSHPEPGMPPKKYYRILVDNFCKEVNEIIDGINNLH